MPRNKFHVDQVGQHCSPILSLSTSNGTRPGGRDERMKRLPGEGREDRLGTDAEDTEVGTACTGHRGGDRARPSTGWAGAPVLRRESVTRRLGKAAASDCCPGQLTARVRFESRSLCDVWCKPLPRNPHGYRVSALDRATHKQRKERDSGGQRSEIGTKTNALNFAVPAKPRHYWAFADTKKPGASPGFDVLVG